MAKVGDKIQIFYVEGNPKASNKTGTITKINEYGELEGTWGDFVVIPDVDSYSVIKNNDKRVK